MAQDTTTQTEAEKLKADNAATIAKLNSQSLEGQPIAADTISALDTLAEGIVQKKKADAEKIDEEGNDADAAAKAEADAKAAADKAAADKAEADAAAAATKTPEQISEEAAAKAAAAKTPEQIAAEEKLAADRAAAEAFFKDSPVLPAKASPKSAEAFESVKIKAAQEISKLSAELEAHRKEVEQLRQVTKTALTPEIQAEIDSLREFRAKLDVETDPRFKKFDAEIKQGDAFIYAQLAKSPLFTPAVKAEIEKHGGPSKVRMDTILQGINDPLTTRLVEGKLAEIEVKNYEKQQAITAAQANVKEYLTERQKEWEASGTAHNEATKAELAGISTKLPWLNPVQITPTLTKEQKEQAEAHNAFATKARQELEVALNDDSPAMRATLLIGMANLFRTQNTAQVLKTERDALKVKLDAAEASLAKLKGASVSRLRDTGGLPGGVQRPAAPKESDQFTMNAGDALDAIRRAKASAQN